MARYRITGPDGATYEVTAPDGASQEDVMAYVQANHQQAQPKAITPQAPSPEQLARQTYDSMPAWQRTLASAGAEFTSLGRGIGQLVTPNDSAVHQRLTAAADADQPTQAAPHGATNVLGRALPYLSTLPLGGPEAGILARVPQAGRLAQAAIRLGSAAAEGAAYGAAQQTGTGDSRTQNALHGLEAGALAHGATRALGAPLRAVAQPLDDYTAGLAAKAQAMGLKLGAGELSSNPMVQTVANQLGRLPLGGGAARALQNRQRFTQAVGETFGAKGDALTPDVFSAAKQAIGGQFNTLTDRNTLQLQPDHLRALADVANRASAEGTSDAGRLVANRLDELLNKAGPDGQLSGRAYQSLDADIGQQAKQLERTDPSAAMHLRNLRDAMRSAMDDSITPADQAAWKQARALWGNMKTVEPLVGKSPDGTISPASLMQRVNAGGGSARMATDSAGPLGDLARIGQRFLKEPPNSGSADRMLVNRIIASPLTQAGALGGAAYGAHQAGWLSPEEAAWTGALLLGNRYGLQAANAAARSGALARLMADGGNAEAARALADTAARRGAILQMMQSRNQSP